MLKNFRAYHRAVNFYLQSRDQRLPSHLNNQLERAASSIALNLAEGYGRHTRGDQKRFYSIALGSTRECQAIIQLTLTSEHALWSELDILAAHIVKLLSYYK